MRDKRILLGHRSPTLVYYPDVWDLIGGHVKLGESAVQAMLREANEEVGCIPTNYDLLTTVQEPNVALHGPGEFHIYVVRDRTGGEPRVRNHEHDRLGWFSLEEIKALRLADVAYLEVFEKLRCV